MTAGFLFKKHVLKVLSLQITVKRRSEYLDSKALHFRG